MINFSPPYQNILTEKEGFLFLLQYILDVHAKRLQSWEVPIPDMSFRNIQYIKIN